MLVKQISFKARGVTFQNEDNKDIQKEIKRILNEYKKNEYFDKLYGGYTNKEIIEMDLNVPEYDGYSFPAKLVGDEYNGEDCLKIYFKTYDDKYVHVGYAPKEKVNDIVEWISKKDLQIDGKLNIVGGKYKYAEVYEEDYEEKERVAKQELTYGIEITLSFYDSKIDPKYQEEQERIKKVEREIKIGETIGQLVAAALIIGGIVGFVSIMSFISNLLS